MNLLWPSLGWSKNSWRQCLFLDRLFPLVIRKVHPPRFLHDLLARLRSLHITLDHPLVALHLRLLPLFAKQRRSPSPRRIRRPLAMVSPASSSPCLMVWMEKTWWHG